MIQDVNDRILNSFARNKKNLCACVCYKAENTKSCYVHIIQKDFNYLYGVEVSARNSRRISKKQEKKMNEKKIQFQNIKLHFRCKSLNHHRRSSWSVSIQKLDNNSNYPKPHTYGIFKIISWLYAWLLWRISRCPDSLFNFAAHLNPPIKYPSFSISFMSFCSF